MRCGHCGHEFEAFPGEPCPRCGHSEDLPGPGDAPPPGAAPPGTSAAGPPPPPPPAGIPWERERSLTALLATLRGALLQPSRLFRAADPQAGIVPAFVYALLLGWIGGMVALVWNLLLRSLTPRGGPGLADLPPEFTSMLEVMESPLGAALNAVLLPVFLTVGLFLWSGVVHLLLMLFGGAGRAFDATFRTIGFAHGSTALLEVVPFCGWFLAIVWSLVIQINGLREMHRTSTGLAAAAVLLPLILCCCLCAGLVAVAFLLGGMAAFGGLAG